MTPGGRKVAAFDFDGTLSRRDVLMPFLGRACGAVEIGAAVARCVPTTMRARLGRTAGSIETRDVTKAVLLRSLLRDRPASWLDAKGEEFSRDLPGRLRPEMVERAAWHRAQGHELVLVSASLGAYLRPFARDHGFDHVIAVEMAAAPGAGRLTGEMVGPNVRGPEKAKRLRAWLEGDEPDHLWAYGNSSGDRELLAMADTPTWVGGYRP